MKHSCITYPRPEQREDSTINASAAFELKKLQNPNNLQFAAYNLWHKQAKAHLHLPVLWRSIGVNMKPATDNNELLLLKAYW